MEKIILASASERRRDLLKQVGIDFDVIVSGADETVSDELPPDELVKYLAVLKAESVAEYNPGRVVVGADTIVYADGEVIGKPQDKDDAYRILRKLSGKAHKVYTGLAVIDKNNNRTVIADMTEVTMRFISEEELRCYVESGEPMGKAGGYAIQQRAALFITEIHGDFYTVVGLPVARLWDILVNCKSKFQS